MFFEILVVINRRGARVVEWTGLENQRSASYRGFESHPLRKIGSVVQLVRIQACHAWGREFESRPNRICLFSSVGRAADL